MLSFNCDWLCKFSRVATQLVHCTNKLIALQEVQTGLRGGFDVDMSTFRKCILWNMELKPIVFAVKVLASICDHHLLFTNNLNPKYSILTCKSHETETNYQ